MATAALAVSLGALAQPAHSENRSSTTPLTSNGRVEAMMRNMDRFQARQEQSQRYYVERQRQSDQYAMRASSSTTLRR